jgi:hypothetical protein
MFNHILKNNIKHLGQIFVIALFVLSPFSNVEAGIVGKSLDWHS